MSEDFDSVSRCPYSHSSNISPVPYTRSERFGMTSQDLVTATPSDVVNDTLGREYASALARSMQGSASFWHELFFTNGPLSTVEAAERREALSVNLDDSRSVSSLFLKHREALRDLPNSSPSEVRELWRHAVERWGCAVAQQSEIDQAVFAYATHVDPSGSRSAQDQTFAAAGYSDSADPLLNADACGSHWFEKIVQGEWKSILSARNCLHFHLLYGSRLYRENAFDEPLVMAAGPDAPYRGGLGAPSTEEVDAMRSRYETGIKNFRNHMALTSSSSSVPKGFPNQSEVHLTDGQVDTLVALRLGLDSQAAGVYDKMLKHQPVTMAEFEAARSRNLSSGPLRQALLSVWTRSGLSPEDPRLLRSYSRYQNAYKDMKLGLAEKEKERLQRLEQEPFIESWLDTAAPDEGPQDVGADRETSDGLGM